MTETINAVNDILSLANPANSLTEVGTNINEGNYSGALAAAPLALLDTATIGKSKTLNVSNKVLNGVTKLGLNQIITRGFKPDGIKNNE